jgi:hypothetical protein
MTSKVLAVVACVLCAGMLDVPRAGAQSGIWQWSVEQIINNQLTVFGIDQSVAPRNNRSVALSPDGRFLYLGYGSPGNLVRKVEIGHAPADNQAAVKAQLQLAVGGGLVWAKSIATDDVGRVYLTRDTEIDVYDAALATLLLTVTGFSQTNGVHVVRKGPGVLYLYHAEREIGAGQVGRMLLHEATDFVGGALPWSGDPAFGTNGRVDLGPGAVDVRGLTVDADGDAWVADRGGTVFRVSGSGSVLASVAVPSAFDVYVDGERVYVSQDHTVTITVIDRKSLSTYTRSIPFTQLGLVDAYSPPAGYEGTLGGIDGYRGVGIFVTNEAGGSVVPSPFRPGPDDDDDPVLRMEPSSDFDQDGDVDLADFLHFQGCFNGPNRPALGADCDGADLDSDNDVDLADFLAFQGCFNGPNRPPACGP